MGHLYKQLLCKNIYLLSHVCRDAAMIATFFLHSTSTTCTITEVKQIYFPSCLFFPLIILSKISHVISLFQQSTFDFFVFSLQYTCFLFHSCPYSLFYLDLLVILKKKKLPNELMLIDFLLHLFSNT